ncbi:penicillin-binding protein 2 [Thalassolituus oleivorans]|jgi:penicillin-binding protein 2|uniref:penicillin-binding protein 2 n=1 Tax=Thalassolituus oleivorans TaxID=187493 RepID=UPI00042DB960|nr:penicillin-binding protein 2 [Thalassolituus oleivorans]PHQ83997.1 MAG: penicillin-binding protein 2 [Thalassobium sp.]AHK15025.1 penicillin-binding protein 2 [Thalassolituus oleivorans R6-15]MBQ0727192.1 penicillin-binding protein 2 [Thalassolituus oleivorans]MBQ0780004.1 penicillin-binding protein 2 [Thalassolituus oleivorans]MCA6128190.1 penicillin-binding protein 2 [Thalassolituus oleivorans 4BN06-13]
MWEHSFRDKTAERRLFRARAITLGLFIFIMLCGLAWRMSYLQIELHEKYKNLSENNRVQLRPLAPNRGLIYDRNGVLLAENIPSYSLTIVAERVRDLDQTLTFLNDLIEISERDREQFDKRLKFRRRPFEPVVLRYRLSEEEIAKVLVNRFYLPGVDVEAQLVRHYPNGNAFAHVLGYVGRINEKDQALLDTDPDVKRRYSATQYIGKTGVERRYEEDLHGEVGYQKVETNARGRILSVIEQQDPIPGKDLTLHLDARLQKLAEKEMTGRRGAVVAIEVATGGIVALYSNPAFDPNSFVTGISHKDYSDLRDDPDQPLFDRATRGQYPPASTLKPFIGLAALNAGTTNWNDSIRDQGWYKLDNDERLYRDWKRGGHGRVDLERAVVESCDTYFYDVAVRTGIDGITPFLAQFGFGRDMTLDVISALPGLLPDRDWKKAHRRGSWYAGDTVNLGIGQGFMLTTPLQLATATAVLANRGKWQIPRLIYAHNEVEDVIEHGDIPDIQLRNPDNWNRMFNAMANVVSGQHGTARRLLSNMQFPMAAKTGTAQVVGIKQDEEYDSEALRERLRDHALFIAFAPVDNPQIAIAVIVENGESAGKTAGPIAQSIINEYLGGAEG